MKGIVFFLTFILIIINASCFLIKTDVTETEPNDTFSQANHLLVDYDNIEASIDPADDKDYYLFDGLTGESFTVNALYISGSLNVVLRIYNEAEELLYESNDSPESGDESISFDAVEDGVIYIEITSSGSASSGDYEVNALTGKK